MRLRSRGRGGSAAGGVVGVDPATDADITAIWDYSAALTDAFGVYQITDPIGGFNMLQPADAAKPALGADGVEPDGTDDEVHGGSAFSTAVMPEAASTIVAAFKSPASISTDAVVVEGYFNEPLLIHAGSYASLFWFRSTGPALGVTMYNGAGYDGVQTTIATSTWYVAAIRWNGTTLGISLNGAAWQEVAATPSLPNNLVTMFRNYNSTALSAPTMSYVACMGAYKSNAEVQDMLSWLTANKIP